MKWPNTMVTRENPAHPHHPPENHQNLHNLNLMETLHPKTSVQEIQRKEKTE